MRLSPLLLLPVLALGLAACSGGSASPSAGAGDRLLVATTVSPITSIASAVAGGLADIEGIIPEGTNSHTFEPEPGMLVDDMAKFEVLKKHITSARFGLTLDIGHVFCTETAPLRQVYGRYSNLVRNIHLEDIRDRKHEHLMFGDGDLNFPAILRVLADNKYTGLINVELSRDSHRAPDVCRRSIEFLQAACKPLIGPTSATP